jgi:hypothetical protein
MSVAPPAYLELVDFLAAGTTPEALVRFRPSAEVQRRVSELIEGRQNGVLSAEEESELEDFLQLEHLLILAKAQARRHLSFAERP